MKNMLLGMTVLATLALVSGAFAFPPGGKGMGPGGCGAGAVERTVTNTDNGVRIEISSDDPDVVAKIQERHAELPPGGQGICSLDGVERTVTNTDTGVVIDITAEDAALIEEIQERFADGGRKAFGGRHGRGPGCGPRGMIEGADRVVTNTEDGVTITITSEDEAVVEQIQARFADRNSNTARNGKGCNKKQGRRQGRHSVRGGHGRHGGFGGPGMVAGAERTVTNTENGVTITITSDDPDVVETIQARFAAVPVAPEEAAPADAEAVEDAATSTQETE